MSKKGFEIVEHYKSLLGPAIAKRLGVSSKLFEAKGCGPEELEEAEYGYLETQEVGHDAKQGKQKPVQSIDDPKNGSAAAPNLVNKGSNTHKEDGMLEEEDDRLKPGSYERWPDHVGDIRSRDERNKSRSRGGNKLKTMNLEPPAPKDTRLDSPDLEENITQYGYDAKQEVGHEKKQGTQKPMQSIDEPTGVQAGSQDPGLRNKGGNTHKEDGLTESEAWGKPEEFAGVPKGASWEETKQHLEKALESYKSKSGRLNQNLAQQMERALKFHNKTKSPSNEDPNVALNEAVDKLVKSVSKFRKARGK